MKTNIKTFQDACKALNITSELPQFPALSEQDQKAMQAHYKLTIIAKALNEGWTPNWDNSSELKYYPWFRLSASGVGFWYYGYDCDSSDSCVGSRLCFKSSDLAEYAGNTFKEVYQDYFLIQHT